MWIQYLLLGSFFLYLLSSVAFTVAVAEEDRQVGVWRKVAMGLCLAGATLQLVFILFRVINGGHFPTSNLFEFTAFLCFTLVLSYVVLYFFYHKVAVLGASVMVLAVVLLAYAAVFPRDVQPLIPALQSHWLYIHVTTAALGQGAFAVGFVAGLIYLVHHVGQHKDRRRVFWLEVVFVIGLMFVSFSFLHLSFEISGYKVTYEHMVAGEKKTQEYTLPPLVKPYDGKMVRENISDFPSLSGVPSFSVPKWMKGEQAAKKFNSLIWAMTTGLLLYGLCCLSSGRYLYEWVYPLVKSIDKEWMDEISYRAIAIGFPIFTLGALVFAMIWAHEAWGRFWGWDPKETWALITWLFYSAYLHLRLSRGWHGERSAWLAVGGFVIIMINLIVINLVISGLHSYAGG